MPTNTPSKVYPSLFKHKQFRTYPLGDNFSTCLAYGSWYLLHRHKLLTTEAFPSMNKAKQRVTEFLLFFGHGDFYIPMVEGETS